MKIIPYTITVGIIILITWSAPIFAEDYLQLITTIHIDRDSTEITSVEPIGDFNADGYGDLAIGIFHPPFDLYEAVYLYYGGPAFDEFPDLIFMGDPQDETYCGEYFDLPTSYGWEVAGLGDFNGDGFDDFAVSAAALCGESMIHNGRIYIYFGSPNPDTTADIIIDGEDSYDGFGASLKSGDFNGDNCGDLFTYTIDRWIGQKLYVYQGSDPPNNQRDWFHDYSNTGNSASLLRGGFDINGDGFDDFAWYVGMESAPPRYVIMLGSDPLNQTPSDTLIDAYMKVPDDVSNDGIDDFMITYDNSWYLCLGGDPLDTEPDFYMFRYSYNFPFIYSLSGGEPTLVLDCYANPYPHSLVMFNTGVPFDTIPYQIIDYGQTRGQGSLNIGDIDDNGIEDIAMSFEDSTLHSYVDIYSIFTDVAIDDCQEKDLLGEIGLLSGYPNPFNKNAVIRYALAEPGHVNLSIYNLLGQHVVTLFDGPRDAGEYQLIWDASDFPSGVYFARLETGEFRETVKLVLLK
jgi:hypothetical protein